MSRTAARAPGWLPPQKTGTTTSLLGCERESSGTGRLHLLLAASHAMCPGKACTSATTTLCCSLALVPHTPLSKEMRDTAVRPWNGPRSKQRSVLFARYLRYFNFAGEAVASAAGRQGGDVGHAPATPVDAAWVSGVQCVENVSGYICQGADVAAAAGSCHEARSFVLCGEEGVSDVWERALHGTSSTNRALWGDTAVEEP
jgi:hypothetical protein